MSDYAALVFGICCIGGILSLLSYGQGRSESLALGIITLFVIASPIVGAVGELDGESFLDFIETPDVEIDLGYDTVLEDSFAEGIRLAVSEKFAINKDDIRVRVSGFDIQNMCAEKIRVVLSGKAALADYKAVKKYLEGLSIGECSVEIEIG